MRLHHAAALALAGWYLMIPPPLHDAGKSGVDVRARLSEWLVFSAHDAAHECEGAKFLNREAHKQPGDAASAKFDSAQCIATDDPRLKYPTN